MGRLVLGWLLMWGLVGAGCTGSDAPSPTATTYRLPAKAHRPFLQYAHKLRGRYHPLNGPWSLVRTLRDEVSIPQVVLVHQQPERHLPGDTLQFTFYRYHYLDDRWLLMDTDTALTTTHPIQGGFLADYNFDGQLDLYLQDRVVGEGRSTLVFGHLLTFENEGHVWHRALDAVANLHVDDDAKQVRGTKLHFCVETGQYSMCEQAYAWRRGAFEVVGKGCGCFGVE